jgi:uncharacterized protein (DUF1501 family)
MSSNYTPSRRNVLRIGAGAFGAGLCSTPAFAFTGRPDDRKLIFVILRGAMDGLAALPPISDPNYFALRGALAYQPADAIALDATFSMAPGFAGLKPLWDEGELAFLPASGTPYRERSHFEGQAVLESGAPGLVPLGDGWLNRVLAGLGGAQADRALAVATIVPLILSGRLPVSNWAPLGQNLPDDDFMDRLARLYRADPDLTDSLARGRAVHRLADGAEMPQAAMAGTNSMAGGKDAKPMRRVRANNFDQTARVTADLITAQGGPQITVFDIGGFDTHADQGTKEGRLAPRLIDLANGLAGLKERLGPVWAKTVIICASEFGRTVRINGTNGTDHGTGGTAILAGGAVRGGRIIGDWPGLGSSGLYEDRDLKPINDVRGLFKAALIDHLGMDAALVNKAIFPDSSDAKPMADLIKA